MIEVKKLKFSYGQSPILKGLDFSVDKGDMVALLGINGSGKSTLLKNINGLLRPQSGQICIAGRDINTYKKEDLAKKLAYVSQDNSGGKNTVFDTILMGRVPYIRGQVKEEDISIVEKIIQTLDLEKYAMRNTDSLSGGEFQKVIVARALAQDPQLLLLDEPTSNLDIRNQFEVMDIISKYCKEKNIAVIISIHDLNLSLRFSDKFLMLKEGHIYDYGGQEVITEESIRSIYKIPVEIINNKGQKIITLR